MRREGQLGDLNSLPEIACVHLDCVRMIVSISPHSLLHGVDIDCGSVSYFLDHKQKFSKDQVKKWLKLQKRKAFQDIGPAVIRTVIMEYLQPCEYVAQRVYAIARAIREHIGTSNLESPRQQRAAKRRASVI